MPAWLAAALAEIGPITSVATGLTALFNHAKTVIASDADPGTKMHEVAGDVAAAADQVTKALLSNTRHE